MDAALEQLSRRFDGIYAKGVGRPSVPPEQLLRALLLQVLYTIRSERQLIEQIDYNLLYHWFVGLELDEEAAYAQHRGIVAVAVASEVSREPFLTQVWADAENVTNRTRD